MGLNLHAVLQQMFVSGTEVSINISSLRLLVTTRLNQNPKTKGKIKDLLS